MPCVQMGPNAVALREPPANGAALRQSQEICQKWIQGPQGGRLLVDLDQSSAGTDIIAFNSLCLPVCGGSPASLGRIRDPQELAHL
jgi:hypothetical protein